MVESYLPNVWKSWKIKTWTFSPNLFHRARREQVWECGCKPLLNERQLFFSLSVNERKTDSFYQRKFWSNCWFGHVKLNFTTWPITFLPNCFNSFAQNPQTLKKHSFSTKNSSKFPLDRLKALLKLLWRVFGRNPKSFWLIFVRIFPGFLKNKFLRKRQLLTQRESLKESPEKNARKAEFTSLNERKCWKEIFR